MSEVVESGGLSAFGPGKRRAWLLHLTSGQQLCCGARMVVGDRDTPVWAADVASSTGGCSPTGTW